MCIQKKEKREWNFGRYCILSRNYRRTNSGGLGHMSVYPLQPTRSEIILLTLKTTWVFTFICRFVRQILALENRMKHSLDASYNYEIGRTRVFFGSFVVTDSRSSSDLNVTIDVIKYFRNYIFNKFYLRNVCSLNNFKNFRKFFYYNTVHINHIRIKEWKESIRIDLHSLNDLKIKIFYFFRAYFEHFEYFSDILYKNE